MKRVAIDIKADLEEKFRVYCKENKLTPKYEYEKWCENMIKKTLKLKP